MLGCSGDGSVAVGKTSTSSLAYVATVWAGNTAALLPNLIAPGPVESAAYGASGDGSRIVGMSRSRQATWSYLHWRACVWVNGFPNDLGGQPGVNEQATGAHAISRDGNWVAGYVQDPVTGQFCATRFLATGGAQLLGTLTGYPSSDASAINADGTVVVGRCWIGNQQEAFRWTAGTGMVGLGFGSEATAVSADGAVIVGRAPGGGAALWTQNTGWQEIGVGFRATCIADDAELVLGYIPYAGGSNAYHWTPTAGTREIDSVWQSDFGMPAIDFRELAGVSADGTVMVGNSVNSGQPRAFRMQLPRDRWQDLGHALPAAAGAPLLYARGSMLPGTTFQTECSAMPANVMSALVLGFSRQDVPLLGGLLVPTADAVAVLAPRGNQSASRVTVPNLPQFLGGTTFYVQQWVADAAGPMGVTASRALSMQLP